MCEGLEKKDNKVFGYEQSGRKFGTRKKERPKVRRIGDQLINPIWSIDQSDVQPDVLPSNQNAPLSSAVDWLRARFVLTHVVYNIEDTCIILTHTHRWSRAP